MKEFITRSPAETEKAAMLFAQKLKKGDVIAFKGGMGMGKTAFTRGLVRGLGIDDDVSSPTFALVNEYKGSNLTLYHFDMFRVSTPEDLYSTGFYDYMDNHAILAIEWSENIETALPDDAITVDISLHGENERRITIDGGERF